MTEIRFFINKYKLFVLLFAIFLFSRLLFINATDVFFDSEEYIHLFSLSNYFLAIALGHFPPHEGYIVLFWPVFQLATFLKMNAAYCVVLIQIILSFFTIFFFYKFIEYISNKKTAMYASIIASLTPLFWIINATIMMENAYAFFFFLSLYLLSCYFKKNHIHNLHGSLLFFMLSILTQPILIFWTPLYLSIVFFYKRNHLKKVLFLLITYGAISFLLNALFLSIILHMTFTDTFHHLYLSKGGEFAELPFGIKGILIAGRNFFIPLFQNNTILIVIISFISLFISFKRDEKIFFVGLLFILPALYANQWWDSLLNGRHALIAGFGIAFLVAYFIEKKKIIYFLIIVVYLLFVSVPTLTLLNKPIPYIQEENFVKSLPANSLFIESHFARPQVQRTIVARVFYVNEPGYDAETLDKKINIYLKKQEPVYISSAALSEPYGLYSGPYLHNITLSYQNPFFLQSRLSLYSIVLYKTINEKDNLVIYKIVSHRPSPYPSVKNLKDLYRRLDYTDPFWQLTWWFERTSLHQ